MGAGKARRVAVSMACAAEIATLRPTNRVRTKCLHSFKVSSEADRSPVGSRN